jgi:hypothetical protein
MRPSRPEFDERPAARGIFFARSDRRKKARIDDGDIVTLRLGDVSAIVDRTVSIGAGRYRGTIVGFDQGLGPFWEGYSVGDDVEFTERQVFGCASP